MRKTIMALLILTMLCCGGFGSALSVYGVETPNPNEYQLTVELGGTVDEPVYQLIMERIKGTDPIDLFSWHLNVGAAATAVTPVVAANSGLQFTFEEGVFYLYRTTTGSGWTPEWDDNNRVVLATLEVTPWAGISYDSSNLTELNDGISNTGYQAAAAVSVSVAQTASPTFATGGNAAVYTATSTGAAFTLAAAPADGTVFKVYNGDGTAATGVTATVSGSTLALAFEQAPAVAANYLISAVQGGQMESAAVPVSVYVASEAGYSVILPPGAPANLILIEAQYKDGQLLAATMPAYSTDPYTLSLDEGADLCKLFVLNSGSYAPYCANFVWPRS